MPGKTSFTTERSFLGAVGPWAYQFVGTFFPKNGPKLATVPRYTVWKCEKDIPNPRIDIWWFMHVMEPVIDRDLCLACTLVMTYTVRWQHVMNRARGIIDRLTSKLFYGIASSGL